MVKKLAILILTFAGSVSRLNAQVFYPIDGIAYPIEFTEWILNGEDKIPVMQTYLRSGTIAFNSDNTIITIGNALYTATYTIFPNGSCEVAVKALFIRRLISGTGGIERTGNEFTLSLSVPDEKEGKDMFTLIKGYVK